MFTLRNINITHSMPLKDRAVGEPTTLNVQTHGRVSSPYRRIIQNTKTAKQFNQRRGP